MGTVIGDIGHRWPKLVFSLTVARPGYRFRAFGESSGAGTSAKYRIIARRTISVTLTRWPVSSVNKAERRRSVSQTSLSSWINRFVLGGGTGKT